MTMKKPGCRAAACVCVCVRAACRSGAVPHPFCLRVASIIRDDDDDDRAEIHYTTVCSSSTANKVTSEKKRKRGIAGKMAFCVIGY